MKLFLDRELTKEVAELDFGIVLAGDTKKIEYYLYNDTVADIVEIVPSIVHTEVAILSYPKELKSKESNSIIFSWTPSVTLKKGLKTEIDFSFYELYD